MSHFPWLLYAYPWMPFPRRVIIYLREKGISSSLVQVIKVSDPQNGNTVDSKYPPKPPGSLPILAIPQNESRKTFIYIRQSLAIMNYLDELCDSGISPFPPSQHSMRGATALERARVTEVLALADECTANWNPVRTFGTGAGTIKLPEASKEMLRWVRRPLMTIETWWKDRDDLTSLNQGGNGKVTMDMIVLYQFLEFAKDCYGIDMTRGSRKMVKDVYGRDVVEDFPKLREFYEAFRTRNSTMRDASAGEVPSDGPMTAMSTWWDGIID